MSAQWVAFIAGATCVGVPAGFFLCALLTQGRVTTTETERDVYLRALLALLDQEMDEHPERWAESGRLYTTVSKN